MANIIIPQVDLLIKKEEMAQLNNVIGSIPTSFGFNVANFFHLIHQKRLVEAEVAKQQTPG
jgi:hypothetical protein